VQQTCNIHPPQKPSSPPIPPAWHPLHQSIIDRAGPIILQRDLPVKTECVLQLDLAPAQLTLYQQVLDALRQGMGGPQNLLRDSEVRGAAGLRAGGGGRGEGGGCEWGLKERGACVLLWVSEG